MAYGGGLLTAAQSTASCRIMCDSFYSAARAPRINGLGMCILSGDVIQWRQAMNARARARVTADRTASRDTAGHSGAADRHTIWGPRWWGRQSRWRGCRARGRGGIVLSVARAARLIARAAKLVARAAKLVG